MMSNWFPAISLFTHWVTPLRAKSHASSRPTADSRIMKDLAQFLVSHLVLDISIYFVIILIPIWENNPNNKNLDTFGSSSVSGMSLTYKAVREQKL